ncbi:MAG: hypothetical protein VX210_07120, partial [Myxococcota bacterium]|nr:hypothetical protein [Myxococcota bacterium]
PPIFVADNIHYVKPVCGVFLVDLLCFQLLRVWSSFEMVKFGQLMMLRFPAPLQSPLRSSGFLIGAFKVHSRFSLIS